MRHSPSLICLSALALAAPVHGSSWDPLGPAGARVLAIATGDAPAGRYLVVAATLRDRSFLYRSRDNGATWQVGTAPAECRGFIQDLHARRDGRIVVDCGRLFVSHEDDTWTAYGPPGFSGLLAVDPADASRALFAARLRLDSGTLDSTLYVTGNDGVTWSVAGGSVPYVVAFDPSRPGRAVGVTAPFPPAEGYQDVTESLDGGRTWRHLSTIPFEDTCNPMGTFTIDSQGMLYRYSGCGFIRSHDGGVTWSRPPVPQDFLPPLDVDRTLPGHLIGRATAGGLWESFDAGTTWSRLAAPDDLHLLDVAKDLWGSAHSGVRMYDRGQRTWLDRSRGFNALFARPIAVDADHTILADTALGALRLAGEPSPTPLRIDGESIYRWYPNAVLNAPLLVRTASSKLFRTEDVGRTWTLITPGPGVDYDQTYDALVPIGPQPGLVYAIYKTYQGGEFTGCCWAGMDIAKSTDGGQTWTLTRSGAGQVLELYVGRADTRTLFAVGENGLFRSRDAGERWTRIGGPEASGYPLVADPVDPLRWYAVWPGGRLRVSNDVGDTWIDIWVPYAFAGVTDLAIDPADTRRLFLVHEDGGVSLSEDRGQHWRRIVAPSRFLDLMPGTAFLHKAVPDTLYAGSYQGALSLKLNALQPPGPVRAVEYYRPHFDRYFITADRAESRLLDDRAWEPHAYVRTGQEFAVWPSGTTPPAGAAPVCRFYGPPEKRLDSHFFSASPAECDAVKLRFGDAWIYETADAFVASQPDANGACPVGSSPVYRLYNNRADANHRYTASRAVRDEMVAKGWTSEGYGAAGVAMCAP